MTPVQKEALPVILKGSDVVAQAKTGSGKTAAFGLGLLNSLNPTNKKIQSLILCPTRELAEQVAKELRTLARLLKNVKILTICGGTSEYHQEKSLLHGANIIVGTPGRVLRLLSKKTLTFDTCEYFVLDEADKMLDMGFYQDILDIKNDLPSQIQTLLFSATFPDEIKDLSKNIQQDAVDIKVDTKHDEDIINQSFYKLDSHKDKLSTLISVLAQYKPERSIVFCKTKQITDTVASKLRKQGIVAESIHGDLMQNERTNVLTQFSNKSLSVLVATDVAARGIDIQGIEAVFNFDLPYEAESYTHRVGRTGRAGRVGEAFSFFVEQEEFRLESIENIMTTPLVIKDPSELSPGEDFTLVPPMETIYISGGKKNKLRPGDILGALVGEAEINPDDVGSISILNVVSYVAIKKESVDQAIDGLRNGKIKNRRFKVGFA